MGAFVISPLPPVLSEELSTVEPLRSTGITPLQHYYGLLRHPLAFDGFPGRTGYTAYLPPAISNRGKTGFSSCSVGPCNHAIANTPPKERYVSLSFRTALLPSPWYSGLGLWNRFYEATHAFTCVMAWLLANHPNGGIVSRLRNISLPPSRYSC